VLRVEIVGVAEELQHREQLQPLDRLGRPVRVVELHVGVDPGDVAPVVGQMRDADVEQVLLRPQLRPAAHLHVVPVAGRGHGERPLAIGQLHGHQVHARPRHLGGEPLVEPPAAPVADRVGDAGDDVEEVRAHGRGSAGGA
jgi:hypothetical protein